MPSTETAHTQHPSPERTWGPVFDSILCAVDGTNASKAAVRMAAELAQPGGHVTLLAVTAETGSGLNTAAAIARPHAEQVLADAQAVLERAGVRASAVIDPAAPPMTVILARASEHDLLVMGAPATSWLGGLILGGVAAAALSRFEKPLLVVRPSFEGPLEKRPILVASDGEEESDAVVELAARLAQRLDAPVTIVHALESESSGSPRHVEKQAGALRRTLDAGAELRVEPAGAIEAIVGAAERVEPSLLVMGSRRPHGLQVLGSVSRHVLYEAPCAVLVKPPVR